MFLNELLNVFRIVFVLQAYDPRWRKMFMVYGDNPYQQLSESTHNSDIHALFDSGKTC